MQKIVFKYGHIFNTICTYIGVFLSNILTHKSSYQTKTLMHLPLNIDFLMVIPYSFDHVDVYGEPHLPDI